MWAPITIPDELFLLPALSYIEDLAANKQVLVFGPDAGYAANRLAPKAAKVTIMDPAAVRIRYARHRCSHLNAYFEVCRLDDTHLEPESCDIIFGRMTPEIEAHLSEVLSEMARILHPEGLFVLLLPPPRPRRTVHQASGTRIGWKPERQIKAAFPHLEVLEASIELCVFVGPNRRQLPSFQQDMVEPESQLSVPIALCSKIPVVPEDRLLTRFGMNRIFDPVRRRLQSNRRRIERLSQALEELPGSLPPSGSDDLTGVVLETKHDSPLPGGSQKAKTHEIAARKGLDDENAGNELADATAEQASQESGTYSPPESPTDPDEELNVSLSLEIEEDLSGLDMPSPTEQPHFPPRNADVQHERVSPEPVETPFPSPLDAPDDTAPIPPRRRRLEAAMAAPYEVLDRHVQMGKEETVGTSHDDLPPLPAPADDLRKAFLDQWDEIEPETEGETTLSADGLPELPSPTEANSTRRPPMPSHTVPPESLDDTTTTRNADHPIDPAGLPGESTRGERALLQALKKEFLEKLPSVTRIDKS